MVTWLVKLSKFQINFEPIETIISQVLANFITKMAHLPLTCVRTLFVDGSSNMSDSGEGLLLEGIDLH